MTGGAAADERVIAVVVSFSPEPVLFCRLLNALAPQVAGIFIVDNASGAGLENLQRSERVRVIDMAGNAGVAAAQNAGIAKALEAGASHVLLLDHDSVPSATTVSVLMQAWKVLLASGEKVAVVGANYEDPRRPGVSPFIRIDGCRLRRLANTEPSAVVRTSYLISSGSLIGREALLAVGPMEERLFIDYIDIEWGLRASELGWTCHGVCGARLEHALGDEPLRVLSTSYPLRSPLRHYYMVRNGIWLITARPLPIQWKLVEGLRLARRALAYALLTRERGKHAQAMWNGLRDGLSGRMGPMKV